MTLAILPGPAVETAQRKVKSQGRNGRIRTIDVAPGWPFVHKRAMQVWSIIFQCAVFSVNLLQTAAV